MRRHYEAGSTIDAPPERVWAVLADAEAYADWDSGVQRIEGEVAKGNTVKVYSELNPGRGYPINVTEYEPGRGMTWTGGMPFGLFRGVRTHRLTEEGEGRTRFELREDFSGPLTPLIWRSMPDMGPSFRQFADGLERRVEAGA